MILTDIKHYLSKCKLATLKDIAVHVDADPEAVRGMLEYLIRKDRVRKHLATATCGSSCNKCDMSTVEYYQWHERNDSKTVPLIEIPQHCHIRY